MLAIGAQRRMLLGAAAASLLIVTLLVVRLSSAAFFDTTRNDDNSWNTGTVVLADDAPVATAMFSVTDMVPEQVEERCIVVSYTGSVDAYVDLYGANLSQDDALADDLDVQIEQGSGGVFGDCTGFVVDGGAPVFDDTLAVFAATYTGFGDDGLRWTTVPSTDRTYKFTVTLNAASDKQGESAQIDFVWHAENQPPS